MRLESLGITALTLASLLLLPACGGSPETQEGPPTQPTPAASTTTEAAPAAESEPTGRTNPNAPPPVTVLFGDESADLEAFTYCYGNLCVDGAPPADLPSVGSADEIAVEFPLPDWSFNASFKPAGDECGRVQTTKLERTDDGRLLLRPIGHAGSYDVTLFGRGDGDLFVSFRWDTPVDGPLPTPRARLAVLAGDDGEVDSYGVELELSNLARTPRQASARITVTSANGEALTFDATRSRQGCWPEGTVYWDGPDAKGQEAARLGDGPFTYEVVVVLDGERFTATAVWPDDELAGNAPSVPLRFSPALPAVS